MMPLPPFAIPKDFKKAVKAPIQSHACYWFVFSGSRLLVEKERKTLPIAPPLSLKAQLYMGIWNNKDLFVGEVEEVNLAATEQEDTSEFVWVHLRDLHTILDDAEYSLAGRALQMIQWNRSHTFCGRCANTTTSLQDEHCRKCETCGQLAYPKLSLAMIALVKRGDEILLARSPTFPQPFYSPLAGFIEPGETLEQCVEREVFEEVGVRVKNISYFGSQPWPLSQSLMVGFLCEWQEGEISIDPTEIAHAAWFNRSNLPLLPPPYSLGRILVDAYVAGNTGRE